jgi:hypothetical protein
VSDQVLAILLYTKDRKVLIATVAAIFHSYLLLKTPDAIMDALGNGEPLDQL